MDVAGDWIKVEHATAHKPEVLYMAELLGISRREMVGLITDYLIWLDVNARTEFVPNVSRLCLDSSLDCPGFSATMERIGWLKWDENGTMMWIANYAAHNGKSAKTRAYEQKKKSRQREKMRPDFVPVDGGLEKRREEKSIKPEPPHTPPSGVSVETWEAWRRYRKGKLTVDAIRLQTRLLEDEAKRGSDPNAIIEQSIRNGWSGLFPLKTGVNGNHVAALHEKRTQTAKAMYANRPGDSNTPAVEGQAERID
jgi:hypothetical protein